MKEIAMKQLVLALCVLGLVWSACGASASDTEEQSVTFEFALTPETLCFNDDYYYSGHQRM
jgi:hypothetical protein